MLAGASCWVLYVDVLVLEMGGKDDVDVLPLIVCAFVRVIG